VSAVNKATKMTKICVYCGSSNGILDVYSIAAEELGVEMARRDIDLIYGGGSVGLMGKISSAVHVSGGSVLGIIPEQLHPVEISGRSIGEVLVTRDMHERKKRMSALADGFIALPGGLGTLEELLEMLTWRQLGLHLKPIGILNIDGFFDDLLKFIKKAVNAGFISPQSERLLIVSTTPSDLLDKLLADRTFDENV